MVDNILSKLVKQIQMVKRKKEMHKATTTCSLTHAYVFLIDAYQVSSYRTSQKGQYLLYEFYRRSAREYASLRQF